MWVAFLMDLPSSYIHNINELTTYIFLVEFLAFGALLCALLFMLMFVSVVR